VTLLWLDDLRPAPDGWTHVKTVAEAKVLLQDGVERASLDHDLGACDSCMRVHGMADAESWLAAHDFKEMPNCPHVGTGYSLCLWMAETGYWPETPPLVHSANPAGAERMRAVIARYFGQAVRTV
jgi:hypothetical protein